MTANVEDEFGPQSDNARIGLRMRELRLERRLQQADVARELGISPAYLNLIEKGRRTIQLPLLWKALDLFNVDIEPFLRSLDNRPPEDGLARLLDDPLIRSLSITEKDLEGFRAEPKMSATITALFNLYKNTRSQLDALRDGLEASEHARNEAAITHATGAMPFERSPYDEVTDFLQTHNNWFPSLEQAAEKIRREHKLPQRVHPEQLVEVLQERLGVKVKFVRPDDASSVVRHFDQQRGVLTVSRNLGDQRLQFQLAAAIALRLFDENKLVEPIIRSAKVRHAETRELLKINLTNYLAGALLLPYEDFYTESLRTRYDVDRVCAVFNASFETVAHRMCNLSDPKRRALPMHFLRVDIAGNISKRYSATGLRFAQWSGSCPKWAVHVAFLTPSVMTKQYSLMPDGGTYFCVARVMTEPVGGSTVRGTLYSIGLGVHTRDARHLAYADEMPFTDKKMAIPTGVSCRFCERPDCNQRAAPSYKFAFAVDAYTKKDNFFSPLREQDSDALVAIRKHKNDQDESKRRRR